MSVDEENYLAALAEKGFLTVSKEEILRDIENNGRWEEFVEWRISTITEFSIVREIIREKVWYKVAVKCDYEFGCNCPTLERAIEMAGLYQQLLMKLFMQVGWPSWARISSVGKRHM